MAMNAQRVFIFWGVMDLMFLFEFAYWNLSRRRIPLYDDLISFSQVYAQHGWDMLIVFFVASIVLTLSIFLTMLMFIKQSPTVRLIAYLQVPFRLYFVVPSLSFIPGLVRFFEWDQLVLIFSLLIASEVIKVFSLYKARKYQAVGA
ncbi:hypothetical protein D3C87_1704520 [compost metagenome]